MNPRWAWPVLVLSGVVEAVWASALGMSNGFTELTPTIVFGIAIVASTIGLALAMKTIPAGTAYAVWTGIGSVLTVSWAVATGTETINLAKALFLIGIVACVTGLHRLDARESHHAG